MPSRKFHDVDALLAPRLAPDVLLMTDGLSAYRKISAYHRRLKAWMGRFQGVASRTLANYLGWHRLLDAARQTLTPQEFLAASWG